jgi:hypothetical protein
MPGMRSAATTAVLALPLVLAPAASAVAAQPDRYSFTVDDTFLSRTSEDCGFDIIAHVEGTIRVADFLDGDGGQLRTLVTYPSLTYTFTNDATGESVSSRSPDPEHITWHPDGSFAIMVTGLVMHWSVPGEGVLAAQSGRFTVEVDADGDASESDPVGRDDDYHAALCEILAP